MFEKVNPEHPDKIADRIAGAIVDMITHNSSTGQETNERAGIEVLVGHGSCTIIGEVSREINQWDIASIVRRIAGIEEGGITVKLVRQDAHLAGNQEGKIRCGDNGIFKGVPITEEEKKLSEIARLLYKSCKTDGKYILDGKKLIICQSNAKEAFVRACVAKYGFEVVANPLGEWTGGISVDTGATNRKLGSDMGQAVTGGGLHGKDLSKADVTLNIYAHLKAQAEGRPVEISCAIGDEEVDGHQYSELVEIAKHYIANMGGFEKFAEWGLR